MQQPWILYTLCFVLLYTSNVELVSIIKQNNNLFVIVFLWLTLEWKEERMKRIQKNEKKSEQVLFISYNISPKWKLEGRFKVMNLKLILHMKISLLLIYLL